MSPKIKLKIVFILSFSAVISISFQNCSQGFTTGVTQSESNTQSSTDPTSTPLPGSHFSNLTLGWDANTDSELAGYKIYYGASGLSLSKDVGLLQPVNGVVSYTIPNLNSGQTYSFAIVAYDANHVESPNSNEVSQLIQ